MKKIFKTIGIILLAIVVLVALFFGYLTITQLNPETEQATLQTENAATKTITAGEPITALSWNIGYAALGEESDFFMDGGLQTRPESSAVVEKNLAGIVETVLEQNADFTILQEVDSGSMRSYSIDETEALSDAAQQISAYALNYKCDFVPFPWPPIGKVSSGLYTLSAADVADAARVALPSPFTWPVSVANLKRCLLVTRIPVEGSEKELVLINLHLEAYDDGEGKIAQTKVLTALLQSEYEKGNFVIAGGDFNQTFPGVLETYPIKNAELWTPGTLGADMLPEGWQLVCDASVPTCRLLNMPYDPQNDATQYYVIDGFILSPNVQLQQAETLDLGFRFSDHNPVRLSVVLEG